MSALAARLQRSPDMLLAGTPLRSPSVLVEVASLVPSAVAMASARFDDLDPQARELGSVYRDELDGMSDRRAQAFLAGRVSAHRALAKLPGAKLAAVRVGVAGRPAWPVDVVGSIAHAGRVALAAVAWSADCAGLGVDVEERRLSRAVLSVAAGIARADERARLASALGVDEASSLALAFSAKESLFKAVGAPGSFDPSHYAVVEVDAASRSMTLARSSSPALVQVARFLLSDAYVWTAVTLPARR